MNVLVTGGAGYIGSHVCKALFHMKHTPIAFDNLSRGGFLPQAAKWGPQVCGDINDHDLVLETLKSLEVDAVCHLAACTDVGASVKDPFGYYRTNADATMSLVEAISEYQVDRSGPFPVVFASSSAVYGAPTAQPVTEKTILAPINPYGMTKLMGEVLMERFARSHNMPAVSLRLFNVAGADPGGEVGDTNPAPNNLIPRLFRAARDGTPFEVYGDGSQVRDYVHVSDVAQAFVEALHYLGHGYAPRQFNICNGEGRSVSEVIRTVEQVIRRKIEVINAPARPGDPPAMVGSPAFAASELDWCPRMNITAQVHDAWRWGHSSDNPTAFAAVAA